MAKTNKGIYEHAQTLMPGGVNSPVRAFKAVGGVPPIMERADGACLYDVERNKYLDYIGSWGPMILGHGRSEIVEAVRKQAGKAMSFGAPTELEVQMAELVVEMVPCIDMVRMVNSGTEACMSVVRAARANTGRDLLIKFEGCYHGHGDSFLAKAGSGMATFGEPTSPGVPKGAASATLNATFNDLESVTDLFAKYPDQIAAVIVEPVVGNMGCVPPEEGFLENLKTICHDNGALIIFDEVMTGFRLAPGGAQDLFHVIPDLCTLGKVIGGGMPVAAFGGRRDLMKIVSPDGPMYQAGTLSGNPLAMAAGIAQLQILKNNPDIYNDLDKKGAILEEVIINHIQQKGYPVSFNRVGSMATVFFTPEKVRSWKESSSCDTESYARYHRFLLNSGIYMPPAQFEAYFISAAHGFDDIEKTGGLICDALDNVCR